MLFSGIYFFKIKNIKDNTFSLFLIFYIFCSVHVVALLEMKSFGFFLNFISNMQYKKLALWGNNLFLVIFALLMFIRGDLRHKNSNISFKLASKKERDFSIFMKNFLFFAYFLQIVSFTFGLTSNQFEPTIILPFHLNGAIDELRSSITQFLFAIYLYDCFSKGRRVSRKIVVFYIIYCVIEIFICNSKGAILVCFLPAFVLLSQMGRLNYKILLRYLFPLICFVVLTYPIIEKARSDGQITIESLFVAAKSQSSSSKSAEKSSSYIRTFLTGFYYIKVEPYLTTSNTEFDFSRAYVLANIGGGAAFMTRLIDNVPEKDHHSSGVTGLCDALLWGGNLMCNIVVAVLTILAMCADRAKFFQTNPLYRLIFFFWFYERLIATTVSFFMDALFLANIGRVLIKIFMVKFYYNRFYYKKA